MTKLLDHVIAGAILLAMASLCFATDYYTHRAVTVDSYYVTNGLLEVTFDINDDEHGGSFTWSVKYEYAGMERTDSSSSSWSKGDTTASNTMYLGDDAVIRSVRVTSVHVW